MPDTDAPSRNDSSRNDSSRSDSSSAAAVERVNLPALVPQPPAAQMEREPGETWLSRVLRAVFGWKSSARADLQTVLEGGAHGEGGFSPQERTMLTNILALRGRRIDDVMVPRADIISVQQDIPLGDLIKVFEGAGHSRLVVYNETLDDPVGMVHIRDVIAHMAKRATVSAAKSTRRKKPLTANLDLKAVDLAMTLSAAKIIRPILFVPPSMPAIDLLAKMQATRIHLALVIDEYGGTDGIVSIEDMVEQIVGDIEDEHDEDDVPSIVRQADGSFLADARAPLEEVVAAVGSEFDVKEEAAEVDTLAGYIMTQVGRLPARGEVVPGPGDFEIEVLDADPRRLKRVRITRRNGRPGRRTVRSRAERRRRRKCRPTRPHRERSSPRRSRARRMRWSSPGAGAAPRSRSSRARSRCWRSRRSNAWPVLFLTFPVAVWLIDGASAGRLGGVIGAAIAGWCFGLGYFLAGLYWIGHAFLVDAKTFAWLLPFAVLGLPAVLAFYMAFGVRACARAVDARAVAHPRARGRAHGGRMAARPSVLRLSLERVRLRAHRPAGAGAGRVAGRPVGADVPRGRGCSQARRCSPTTGATRRGRGSSCSFRSASSARSRPTARCGLRKRRRSSSPA